MKRIKSLDPLRQERWEHKGRKYSIVDLTIAPLEANGHRASDYTGSEFTKLMTEFYGEYRFELADVTDEIEVMDRFRSFEEAQKAITDELLTKEDKT